MCNTVNYAYLTIAKGELIKSRIDFYQALIVHFYLKNGSTTIIATKFLPIHYTLLGSLRFSLSTLSWLRHGKRHVRITKIRIINRDKCFGLSTELNKLVVCLRLFRRMHVVESTYPS